MEETAKILIAIDGGENKKVIAFIEKDGSFGGSCEPDHLEKDKRFGAIKHKLTTNGKYCRWKCGLITSNEL